MVTCSLKLRPYSGSESNYYRCDENHARYFDESYYDSNSFEIPLTQDGEAVVLEEENCGRDIFAQFSYRILLSAANGFDAEDVQDVRVYVNDDLELPKLDFTQSRKLSLRFPGEDRKERPIFLDCFGYAQLCVELVMKDQKVYTLYSKFLPVKVSAFDPFNRAVGAMAEYVYDRQEAFLLNGELKSRSLAALKKGGYRSLETRIRCAREIAMLYESNYGYFKANSRFHVKKTAVIDQFERLNQLSSNTVCHIASHPEQLAPAARGAGIRVDRRFYQPRKTLMTRNVRSFDIYENKVIVGFLRNMIDELGRLRNQCSEIPDGSAGRGRPDDSYMYSSEFVLAKPRMTLKRSAEQLDQLIGKFRKLLGLYQRALDIPAEPLTGAPKPSKIFLCVPQYNKIFTCIRNWFNLGIYDLASEKDLLLSFVKISTLYESYVLTKMIAYLSGARGYELKKSKKRKYPLPETALHKNTRIKNTFYFSDEKDKVTLYYQPVIFNTSERLNGIGLYRNNDVPVSGEAKGANYYTPDFLLKVDRDAKITYIILDAKFSKFENVKQKQFRDLAFKYLISLSPIGEKEFVAGMCILYGRNRDSERDLKSFYDPQLSERPIAPFAEAIPLMEWEGIEEAQFAMLDRLMARIPE